MSKILSVFVLLIVFSFGLFSSSAVLADTCDVCDVNTVVVDCGTGFECRGDKVDTADTGKDGLCQEPGKTAICNPLKAPSFTGVIDNLLRFLFNIAIVVAPIVIISAGFIFLTAGDNPEKIQKAKMVIMWASIGLIIIILSRGLITVIEVVLRGSV